MLKSLIYNQLEVSASLTRANRSLQVFINHCLTGTCRSFSASHPASKGANVGNPYGSITEFRGASWVDQTFWLRKSLITSTLLRCAPTQAQVGTQAANASLP